MSKVIEINEDSWQFKVKGRMLNIAQATVKQELEQEKLLMELSGDKASGEELFEAQLKYLVSLGGDEGILRDVSRHGFMTILQTISDLSKKN